MHVLFTALPYPSHLRTFVPVGQALLARGHRVSAALPASAHRHLAPYGFDLVAIDAPPAASRGRPAPAVPEEFAGVLAWRNAIEYLRVAEQADADLVLREDTEFGGYLAAERLGLPHACIGSCGAANTLDPGWLLPRLDAHRARLGLPPDPEGAALYGHRFIDFLPPAYPFARHPIPGSRAYRLPLPEHPGESLPPWAADLPSDRPLVLAATGTLAYPHAGRMARATVEALAGLDCAAVVVTGVDVTAPPNVRVVEHVPQPLLLPTCDLFITHGGLNSVREAMQCGVPLVLTPFGADQPNNAERCAAYGLGVRVDPATVTPEELRDACRRVLGEPAFRTRVRQAQRRFLSLPDATAAADDLAALAGEGQAPGSAGTSQR
jgi:N-glycosyltransferase